MEEIAIEVKNLCKMYKLYNKPIDRLKESLSITKKKYYKEHHAVNSVSFKVLKGETVGIIGTNGSGKSTILKLITGVLNETSGNIMVNGRCSALLELGAGFNMEYTGIENIYLNGTMLGFTKEEIEKRIANILEFADIGEYIEQPVKTYSSGMFVRLAFAVAINIDPEILIVDEALSVGDVFFQSKCYHKFEDFKKAGKTILFVSHDLGSVAKYCDRVILLNKGKIVQEGNPKHIIDIYKKILIRQSDDDVKNEKLVDKKKKSQIEWKKQLNVNPNTIEYGNREAEIIDYGIINEDGIITNTIDKGEEFLIKFKVIFHKKNKAPIFAYTIKDLKGTELTGTNTLYEEVLFEDPAENDIKEIIFKQKMILQGGEYLLSLGCTGYREGEFLVYHRLYDVCNISVVSERNTVGFFDTYSEVSIN